MRIVFWQNILSPHQIPYIKHMINYVQVDEVILVVGEDLSSDRKEMGWTIPNLGEASNFKVLVSPQKDVIDELFSKDQENSWHLFSGIRGFKFVFDAIKISLNYNVKRGIITERPNTFAFGLSNGKPLWLHRIRFLLQDRKYAKYFDKVFAMGDDAVEYFKSVYNKWEVIPFAYSTEFKANESIIQQNKEINFCFVGSLSWWKAPENIIKASLNINTPISVSFIGAGKKEKEIHRLLKYSSLIKTKFYGFQKKSRVNELFIEHDVLILPSIYDGWGAVVNEALQAGLYVICSDKCGAKELLNNSRIGKVYNSNNIKELSDIMSYCIENIDKIRNDRSYRIEWATRCINGPVIAKYMIDSLLGIKKVRPWFNEK